MGIFYDGTKLLSMKDLNGNTPEIIICTSNRSAGKTTFFSRMFVKKFIDNNEKFMLLYRYKYELHDCVDKFYAEIKKLFFPKHIMTSRMKGKGLYVELRLDDKICGYAIALNSADNVKKYSHLFSDCKRILFDEFQSEDNNYCSHEISKFISIHTSIARGNGEQVRYLPIYMLSNNVSLVNPYYVELNILDRLTPEVNFLRGNGWVLEQGFNESASQKQEESIFMQAFKNNDYVNYSKSKSYLNDNSNFIEKISGKNRYVLTLKFENKEYAIREYPELNLMYCDDKIDEQFPIRVAVTTDDHQVNYIMLKQYYAIILTLKTYFERGLFRFKNQGCKSALISTFKGVYN